MSKETIFLVGLSLLFVHEMDAVRCREWRIFPGLSLLTDKAGFLVFSAAHIPILFCLFYELFVLNNQNLVTPINIFFIIHLGLHLLFLKHKKNEFKDVFSWTIISGLAVCGITGLIVS